MWSSSMIFLNSAVSLSAMYGIFASFFPFFFPLFFFPFNANANEYSSAFYSGKYLLRKSILSYLFGDHRVLESLHEEIMISIIVQLIKFRHILSSFLCQTFEFLCGFFFQIWSLVPILCSCFFSFPCLWLIMILCFGFLFGLFIPFGKFYLIVFSLDIHIQTQKSSSFL